MPILDKTLSEAAAPGATAPLEKLHRPNLNRQVAIWVPRTRRTARSTSEIKTGILRSETKTGTLRSEFKTGDPQPEIKTGPLQSETGTTHLRETPGVSLMRQSCRAPDRDNATLLRLRPSGNCRHTSRTHQGKKPSSLAGPARRLGRYTAWNF